jgi:hypothetical protein
MQAFARSKWSKFKLVFFWVFQLFLTLNFFKEMQFYSQETNVPGVVVNSQTNKKWLFNKTKFK